MGAPLTTLIEILQQKSRLLTTEFLPPKTPQLSSLVDKVLRVASIVDSVSMPELKANPASTSHFRMNSIFAALRVRDLTGVETTFHLTPRDYNKNAIAGLLLSASETGLRNVLVIGGDRYDSAEEKALSRNVYDFANCTSLLKAIRELEQNSPGETKFCLMVGADPTVMYTRDRVRIESEVAKLIERQDAGAEIAQTQPIFDLRYFEFLDLAREQGLKIPMLVGVLPLRDRRDSIDVEKRYGITIPSDVKSALSERGSESGRLLAQDLAATLVKNGARNIHVYPREDCGFVKAVAGAISSQSQQEEPPS
jgi:methylenetetrahydrofolate reductase (NADPH)